jgi:hypothetical protein
MTAAGGMRKGVQGLPQHLHAGPRGGRRVILTYPGCRNVEPPMTKPGEMKLVELFGARSTPPNREARTAQIPERRADDLSQTPARKAPQSGGDWGPFSKSFLGICSCQKLHQMDGSGGHCRLSPLVVSPNQGGPRVPSKQVRSLEWPGKRPLRDANRFAGKSEQAIQHAPSRCLALV